MTIRTALSSKNEPADAAAELRAALGDSNALVIYFASPRLQAGDLAASMHRAFSGVPTLGCTTAGELGSGRMLKGSCVAMAFGPDDVDSVGVALVSNVRDPATVDAALARAAHDTPVATLDPERWCGIVVHDGLSVGEESVMERLADRTNVRFIGGSAGDDARFERTFVAVGGEAYSGASALALFRPRRPFHILKTQSFEVLDGALVVTDVDEATRTVRAFNGRPAVEEYARIVGVEPSELPGQFMRHPLGLIMPDGEPFVRSPQRVQGQDVVFFCQVRPGMELRLLRARDIVEDTRRDLAAKIAEVGTPSGVLNFHCILRTLELEEKGQMEAYGKLFADVPTVGFSTYGESYVGHINQTSTMVLFE